MLDAVNEYQYFDCNIDRSNLQINPTLLPEFQSLVGEYAGHFIYEAYKWDVSFSLEYLDDVLCVISKNEPLLKDQQPVYPLTFAQAKAIDSGRELDFTIESLPDYMLKVILNEDGTVRKIQLDGENKIGYVEALPKE